MKVTDHGECRTLETRAYDHSRGVYYALVRLPDGKEAVVTSRAYNGPYRVTAPYVLRPVADVRPQA